MENLIENKYALIIAIEHYKDKHISDVRFAENDAKELRNVFLSIGYKDENIFLLIDDDATKTLLEAGLKKILKSITREEELTIFYAGHGFTKNNHNYITSFDTVLSELEDT
ncbi:MAG: caspase family protein, partial [Ignavibacteriaceae bacterium]